MIYLFYGSDSEKVRRKAFEWVAAARKKEPNLAYVRLAREDLSSGALLEAATSNSLFAKRTLTLIDDPFMGSKDIVSPSSDDGLTMSQHDELTSSSVLDDCIDMLAASDNAIVILAPKLIAVRAKKLAAKAKVTYEYTENVEVGLPQRGFNSALVNALAAKSREKLWLELNRSLRAGDAPEMLHGLLHWKARDLMGGKLNLPPKWTAVEARALSLSLITLIQSSRRGGQDLSESLERFVLSV